MVKSVAKNLSVPTFIFDRAKKFGQVRLKSGQMAKKSGQMAKSGHKSGQRNLGEIY